MRPTEKKFGMGPRFTDVTAQDIDAIRDKYADDAASEMNLDQFQSDFVQSAAESTMTAVCINGTFREKPELALATLFMCGVRAGWYLRQDAEVKEG
jgi:hypothetical protein